jgi:hypothetical protein
MAKDSNDQCPIYVMAKLNKQGGEQGFSTKCRGDKCSWWSSANSKCAVLQIAEKA